MCQRPHMHTPAHKICRDQVKDKHVHIDMPANAQTQAHEGAQTCHCFPF